MRKNKGAYQNIFFLSLPQEMSLNPVTFEENAQLDTEKIFCEGACACCAAVRCKKANRKDSHHISMGTSQY